MVCAILYLDNASNELDFVRGNQDMRNYHFAVVVEKDEEGYFAYCPELQGCYTQGETFEEVMENVKDAIKLHVEDRLANG